MIFSKIILSNVTQKNKVRDFEALNELAEKVGMSLANDHKMPANNRLLVWEKSN